MTTGNVDKKRLIFPGLAELSETFSPASYSFMRFATGAVLLPHGIQKIMLGNAERLAPLIDKYIFLQTFPINPGSLLDTSRPRAFPEAGRDVCFRG